ncbi:MAG: NAD(P)/FAD-dependent oxidoreductase [Nitrospinae bacterium]|nr:NAD(P)/FAD-dependent oxidoreductase [Nitrospinota bacterium]
MKIVIVGNSAAAVGCIEAIRQHDKKVEIQVITDEKYHTYSRPGITYLLGKKINEEKMLYRPLDFYKKHAIKTRFETKVTKVDTANKVVITGIGEKIPYDKLLLGTGGIPFVPPIKGRFDHKSVFSYTKWEDAEKVMEVVKTRKKAVVIGAGMIGSKTVEGLSMIGCDVTVVELGKNVLGLALDNTASSMVEARMKEKGVKVLTSNEVTEIYGKDDVEGVIMRDGDEIPCDFVIIAVGVFPNTEMVKGTDIEVNRGIVVNEKMETSAKDVYAAGDCAEGYDVLAEIKRPIPIWPVAYSQGKIAGLNMIGKNAVHQGNFPINAIEFDGVPTISVGITNPDENAGFEVISEKEGNNYRKIVLKDDVVKGAVFVGDLTRSGLITGLIERKEKITEYKDELLGNDLGFVHYKRELRDSKLTQNKNWLE